MCLLMCFVAEIRKRKKGKEEAEREGKERKAESRREAANGEAEGGQSSSSGNTGSVEGTRVGRARDNRREETSARHQDTTQENKA